MFWSRIVFLGIVGVALTATTATAQSLGTFRWQIQPYCNVFTVSVIQQGGIYTLDGTDDRCGASEAASVSGIAFLHPTGAVGFGLTTVLPGGVPVHLEANISLASLNGTWRDSFGNSGTLVFTPGAGTGGAPRPVTDSTIVPGSITTIHIAPSAVTGSEIADASLTQADLADGPRSAAAESPDVVLTTTAATVAEVTIVAPAAGRIIANASGSYWMAQAGTLDIGRCSITTGTAIEESRQAFGREGTADSYYGLPWGLTRAYSVAAGSSTTIRLVCDAFAGTVLLTAPSLTAIFIAGS